MSPYFDGNTHIRGDGTPIPRPERPAPGASRVDVAKFIRAVHRYNDQVYAVGNAFDVAFREGLR